MKTLRKRKHRWMILILSILLSICTNITAPHRLMLADAIGPDCETCQGSIITLEFLTPPKYFVGLSIDTSGYEGGGSFIDLIGIKSGEVIDAQPPYPDYPWDVEVEDGFAYAHGKAPVGGLILLLLEIKTESDNLTDPSTIQVRYVDEDGNQVGPMTFENIPTTLCENCGGVPGTPPTPTPEPNSLMLLIGAGLIGAGLTKFPRFKKCQAGPPR